MFWIFASVALFLVVANPGFRKFAGYAAAALVGLFALIWVIGLMMAHA